MSVLLQMGPEALKHRDKLEEVKRRVGIKHEQFDCWIYGFLENKNFDIDETVAKLFRRADMERNELGTYDITDPMRESMRSGVIQLVGDDREGRPVFYITTARDFPTAAQRDERRRNFDMWASFGTRLRRENKRCRFIMLINQDKASMWTNTDMAFQSNIALRIAKFYPGVVEKMYICKMGYALSTFAKPVFARLPKVVSERIYIFTDAEIKNGKLLELIAPEVLPTTLGGKNDIDAQPNWDRFAATIEAYYLRLREAIRSGKSVKDWELDMLEKDLAEERSANQSFAAARGPSGSAAAPNPTTTGIATWGGGGGQHSRNVSDSSTTQRSALQTSQRELTPPQLPLINPGSNAAAGAAAARLTLHVAASSSSHPTHHHRDSSALSDRTMQTCASDSDEDAQDDDDNLITLPEQPDVPVHSTIATNLPHPPPPSDVLHNQRTPPRRTTLQPLPSLGNHVPVVDPNNVITATETEMGEVIQPVRRPQLLRGDQQQQQQSFDSEGIRVHSAELTPSSSGMYHQQTRNSASRNSGLMISDALNPRSPPPNSGGLQVSWADLQQHPNNSSSNHPWISLFEDERHSREFLEEGEQTSFIRLCELYNREQSRIQVENDEEILGDTGANRIATRLFPAPIRSMARGALWLMCVIVAVYFFMATLFLTTLACSIAIQCFMAMFEHPNQIYPLGLGTLLVAHQGCLVTSRGFDLVQSTFQGRLLSVLKPFGSRGLISQFVFFFGIILMQLFIFSYYATILDPLSALSISFATGWMSAAVIIAIYHIFFPFGLREEAPQREAHQHTKNLGGLTLYLFFDITEGDEPQHYHKSARIVAAVPICFALLFGVAFAISKLLFFLVAMPIVTVIAAFVVSYFVSDVQEPDHSISLLQWVTWMAALSWLFVCFALGFFDTSTMSSWGSSSLVVIIVNLTCVFLVAVVSGAPKRLGRYHGYVLRAGYLSLVILIIVGLVLAYVRVWILGLFFTLIFIHSLLSFFRPASASPSGRLTMILGLLLLLLAVILLGWLAGMTTYSSPQSISTAGRPTSPPSAMGNIDPLAGDEGLATLRRPVCLARYSPARLSVTDFALLSELTRGTEGAVAVDEMNWFPRMVRGPLWTARPPFMELVSFIFPLDANATGTNSTNSTAATPAPTTSSNSSSSSNRTGNVTVIAFRSSPSKLQAMQALTLWVEALALSPFALILPTNWTSGIITESSFIHRILDVQWIVAYRSMVEDVARVQNSTLYPESRLLLTGHGLAGGFAALVGARLRIQSVVFGAPGIFYVRGKIDPLIQYNNLNSYVTSVISSNGALTAVDYPGDVAQRLECGNYGAVLCNNEAFFSTKLFAVCSDTVRGRLHQPFLN